MSLTPSGVPSITGTPAFFIRAFEVILSPIWWITSPVGPISLIPFFSHASPNLGFSAKNPYPGWIASAPDSSAISMIFSIFK